MNSHYDIETKMESVSRKIESVKHDLSSLRIPGGKKDCPRFGHHWEGVEGQIANAESKLDKAIAILADAIDTCQMIAREEDRIQDEEE